MEARLYHIEEELRFEVKTAFIGLARNLVVTKVIPIVDAQDLVKKQSIDLRYLSYLGGKTTDNGSNTRYEVYERHGFLPIVVFVSRDLTSLEQHAQEFWVASHVAMKTGLSLSRGLFQSSSILGCDAPKANDQQSIVFSPILHVVPPPTSLVATSTCGEVWCSNPILWVNANEIVAMTLEQISLLAGILSMVWCYEGAVENGFMKKLFDLILLAFIELINMDANQLSLFLTYAREQGTTPHFYPCHCFMVHRPTRVFDAFDDHMSRRELQLYFDFIS
ncbi:hypothetical protein Scep_007782 [Stephania cephalantha]|uniref:Uncharacterized protein n=1 Tax=Stephania cephalantha TaxID=152367 RepID=A0AAP0KD59_9MAGN